MSHPAVKLPAKKLQVIPPETGSSGRRPSNPSLDSVVQENSGFNPHRRRSTYKPANTSFVAAVSLRRMTRHSVPGLTQEAPKAQVKYENTYKMTPDPGTQFLPSQAKAQIQSLLESHLTPDMTYDAATAGHLAETLAEAVKTEVKNLQRPRFKLISTVTLGQCQGQGVEAASRCVWNDATDSYASITHRTKTMFVIATIYGVYFE